MDSKTKGYIGSFVVHIGIIVLLFFFGFSTPLPLPGEDGIMINFGADDMGMGIQEPRPQPREESPQEIKKPEPEEKTPVTQDFEEAPSIPAPKKPPIKEPEDKKPPEKPKEETKPVEKPREIDTKTLFPGRKTDGDNTGEGDKEYKGNQGDPKGSVDSQNRTGGIGTSGDGPSFSLDKRDAIELPNPLYSTQKSGTVVVEVRVDKEGKVISVRGGVRGSTTNDTDLISAAEAAARKARFTVSSSAEAIQSGTITYVFKIRQ
jgi:TonB family protein